MFYLTGRVKINGHLLKSEMAWCDQHQTISNSIKGIQPMTELDLFYPINFQNLLPAPSDAILREYRRVRKQNRRAEKHGAVGNLTVAEWISILDAYEWCCAYCRAPYESMDHVVAVAEGGGTVSSNVVPACKDCNHARSYAATQWPFMVVALERALLMGKEAGILR